MPQCLRCVCGSVHALAQAALVSRREDCHGCGAHARGCSPGRAFVQAQLARLQQAKAAQSDAAAQAEQALSSLQSTEMQLAAQTERAGEQQKAVAENAVLVAQVALFHEQLFLASASAAATAVAAPIATAAALAMAASDSDSSAGFAAELQSQVESLQQRLVQAPAQRC